MQFRHDQLEIIKVGDDLDEAYPLHHPRLFLLATRFPDLYQIRVKKEVAAMLKLTNVDESKAPDPVPDGRKTEADFERDVLIAEIKARGGHVDGRIKSMEKLQAILEETKAAQEAAA
jgi:hypothetical protein